MKVIIDIWIFLQRCVFLSRDLCLLGLIELEIAIFPRLLNKCEHCTEQRSTLEKMNRSSLFSFLSKLQLIFQGSKVARIKDLREKEMFLVLLFIKQWDYLEIVMLRSSLLPLSASCLLVCFGFILVVCLLVLGVKEIVVKKFNYTRKVPIKHIIIGAVSKSTAKLGIR